MLACTPTGEPSETTHDSVGRTGSAVLARVDGIPITKSDVDRALAQALGPAVTAMSDQATRRKVLESLVLSRAMAMQAKLQLPDQTSKELEAQVDLYRETLLAREFIQLEAEDIEINHSVVEAYYRDRPGEFGQKTLRHYELLKGPAAGLSESRPDVVETLGDLTSDESWAEFARQDFVRALGITFFQGTLERNVFPASVYAMIEELEKGDASELFFASGIPYRARVTEVEIVAPRPLPEVWDLALARVKAIELKRAIESVSERVLAQAKVEYVDLERLE